MFRTIQLSSRVSVQGRFVEELENGELVVSDGARTWRGRPVESAWAVPPSIVSALRGAEAANPA